MILLYILTFFFHFKREKDKHHLAENKINVLEYGRKREDGVINISILAMGRGRNQT